jgi:hypothetical protein
MIKAMDVKERKKGVAESYIALTIFSTKAFENAGI